MFNSASGRPSRFEGGDGTCRCPKAVRGVEVFVELVGERAVVAGFGEVVPRWWVRGEEGVTGAKPVVEEFTRQGIGKAKGCEESALLKLFSPYKLG